MNVTSVLNTQSAARKNNAVAIDMASTMIVVMTVSRRVGQVTLATSVRTCWINSKGFVLAIIVLVAEAMPLFPSNPRLGLAGVEDLDPPPPGFGDRCSSQLSYTPIQVSATKPFPGT